MDIVLRLVDMPSIARAIAKTCHMVQRVAGIRPWFSAELASMPSCDGRPGHRACPVRVAADRVGRLTAWISSFKVESFGFGESGVRYAAIADAPVEAQKK